MMRTGLRRRTDWVGRHMDTTSMPPPRRRAIAAPRGSQTAGGLPLDEVRYLQTQEQRQSVPAEARYFVADATVPFSRNRLSQSARAGAGSRTGIITRDPVLGSVRAQRRVRDGAIGSSGTAEHRTADPGRERHHTAPAIHGGSTPGHDP